MTLRKRRPGLVYPVNEDWHYVGSGGGEPAFLTGWTNTSSSFPAMAFRLREGGVVDLVGSVTSDGSGTSVVFEVPATYRPLTGTIAIMPFIRQRSAVKSGQVLLINDVGEVEATDAGTASDVVYIGGSYFLIPPDLA